MKSIFVQKLFLKPNVFAICLINKIHEAKFASRDLMENMSLREIFRKIRNI